MLYHRLIIFLLLIALTSEAGFALKHHPFTFPASAANPATDTVMLHFIHGSVPKRGCSDQRRRLAGRLGGHVELEIGDTVYAFDVKNREKKVHWFSRRRPARYNGVFTAKTKPAWLAETQNDRITSIRLPVTEAEKREILDTYREYLKNTPYDYAFFGMRCTASAHEIMAEAGLFPEKSRSGYIFSSFSPKQLRRKLLAFARKNHLPIVCKPGIDCRRWEPRKWP